jgi:hypothetical protein
LIQLYNDSEGYSCGATGGVKYVSGAGDREGCGRHHADYQDPAWVVDLSEMVRVVQLYNAGGYVGCGKGSVDGYCLK